MISREEFMQLTSLPKFEENHSWKALFVRCSTVLSYLLIFFDDLCLLAA